MITDMSELIKIYVPVCISVLLTLIAYKHALVYNVHMFQLNGYKNKEHLSWLLKYKKRQWVLAACAVFSLAWVLFSGSIAYDIFMWLWLLLVITVYRCLRRMSVKKKLVYTARVKRLITCIIILDAIITAAAFLLLGACCIKGAFALCAGLKFISCIIANILCSPVEKSVNRHFINDAKRKLKEYGPPVIIGVTGSYGKTSVKYYLGELLKVKYNVCITPESYNTPMGVVRTIREHMKPGTEVFVCEMGARHVGDIKELCDLVHPDHGIITSIGPQHLETFFSMENIVSTKYELADAIPEGGLLFLNGDNEYISKKACEYKDPVMYSYVTDKAGKNGYRAKNVTLTSAGTSFDIEGPDGSTESFRMPLIGAHNLINVTGAIAVANRMGIAFKDLIIPVRRLKSVPHRLEMKKVGAVTVIDDAYNSNPAGSSAALDTLSMFDGMKIMITPGMVELGEKEDEYNSAFGAHAALVCEHLLLVGRKRIEAIRSGALSAINDPGAKKVTLKEKSIETFDRFEDAWKHAMNIACEENREKFILIENDLPDNY